MTTAKQKLEERKQKAWQLAIESYKGWRKLILNMTDSPSKKRINKRCDAIKKEWPSQKKVFEEIDKELRAKHSKKSSKPSRLFTGKG